MLPYAQEKIKRKLCQDNARITNTCSRNENIDKYH
ncbi:hypothetical protein SAMN05421659_12015 [[Clostridium] fimetarium]|uniref:Uncharacterized protein n=1 Tax=[Clostridium] fimetarium TaxID=99656 RepID=A0A1I0RP42_9FIRM|nr:hypothetical protein SAMN05421659_12015 [[Clostridium] fimetarium]